MQLVRCFAETKKVEQVAVEERMDNCRGVLAAGLRIFSRKAQRRVLGTLELGDKWAQLENLVRTSEASVGAT